MKNLLILIILLIANISFGQLPIKLTYFTCKSVDIDKIEVRFHTASEINVSTYEVYDGDQNVQSITPRNTTDNTYQFKYKPKTSEGVLKLVSTDHDGIMSVFYSKYDLPEYNDEYHKYTYDGKYLGKVNAQNLEHGFVYVGSNSKSIKK